ncbi:predicted protein [Naegleria gruberi]|uniref:Predicted protein n=1 Tax=Naegleria gruberi TaxID=5762 RepID=D2VLE1_NAEGR|nr:uncharacterized protein NAEGRDRAFT_69747 [Naegleria gruberi]EFC42294.1 predicted protein [Naegleria gruberi]|eukprot:XP_002675038.1 predicted protein [Naegleria gruberi strain NEG-M]
MNAGSIIDYPWSLLSKDKTEEGININNLLLSNPPPSRRSITPVNNLLVFSTPNVDSTANTSLGSSVLLILPLTSSSATSAAIVDLNSVAELPPPPTPPPTISVDLNSTGGTVNPTSSAVSVVVATPVVGLGSSTLPTDSFVGNLNSNTTMVESTPFVRGNDKSNELGDPSTTIDDGPIVVEEPTSLSSAHLHIVTALFQGTDIYVPTSSKPYWAFRAVEAKRLIDNNFALAQHNAYLEKQVKEDSIFQDSITKLVEAKNASRKNTSPIVTTVDLMFDGMTRTVSHEEFEKFKNSSKINETIDQVMQWFDLVEDDLKSKKKEFDTFLLQYKGCKMADSTIRNRVPYARKRDAALASSSTGTSEPPKKARKKSPNSASSSSDDGGDAHSPASNAPHQ